MQTERERCQSPFHAALLLAAHRTAWGTCARYGYASSPISPLLYRMYSKAWLGSPLQTRQLECRPMGTAMLQLLQSQPAELRAAGAQGWQRAPCPPSTNSAPCLEFLARSRHAPAGAEQNLVILEGFSNRNNSVIQERLCSAL